MTMFLHSRRLRIRMSIPLASCLSEESAEEFNLIIAFTYIRDGKCNAEGTPPDTIPYRRPNRAEIAVGMQHSFYSGTKTRK